MNLKRLSCLILLIVIIAAVNAKPPSRTAKKNVNKVTSKPKVKPKSNAVRGRADAYDDDEKPLDPLLPPGDKLTPDIKPETPELTGGTSPELTGGTTHVTTTCQGTCVPYYLCQKDKIVDDGSNLLDAKSDPKPKAELPLDAGKSGICGTFDSCCSDPDKINPGENPTIKYIHRCGIRQANGINRRALTTQGKGEAEFGEWPWQAAILKIGENKEDPLFICGGVIINDQFVITVAHCVVNHLDIIPSLKVRLGEWDTQNNNEIFPHEDFGVVDVIVHQEYRNASLWNDIALLKLDRKVKFRSNIDTICLPEVTDVYEGEECVVTGWGKSAFKGTYSQILKEVRLPVVPRQICQEGLRTTRLGKRFRLHEGFLCAGGTGGIDSCKGDGGGPLACYRKDGTYALAGLVSWGVECGKPGVPGVYVDLRQYNDWIYQKTGLNAKVFKPSIIRQ